MATCFPFSTWWKKDAKSNRGRAFPRVDVPEQHLSQATTQCELHCKSTLALPLHGALDSHVVETRKMMESWNLQVAGRIKSGAKMKRLVTTH